MKKLLIILLFVLMGCGEEIVIINQGDTVMINLSSIFQEANNQSEKERDVLVMVEDATLFKEKTTEADWGNNVSENDVDYTSPEPTAGEVELESLLWVSDVVGDFIYNVKKDGTVVDSFQCSDYDISATDPRGLTYTPNNTLWIIDQNQAKIYHVETDGTLISSFLYTAYDVLAQSPQGIAYADNETLWIVDSDTNKIYNVETDGTLISSFASSVFDAAATFMVGIDYADNGTLWIIDRQTDKIYNIETDGTWISEFATSVYDAGATVPVDLSYAIDDTLWITDSLTNKIYNVETDGTWIREFSSSAHYGITNSKNRNSTGHIQTDTIDIGEVPTQSGEWVLEDVTPDDSDITYVAWHSPTSSSNIEIEEKNTTGSSYTNLAYYSGGAPRVDLNWQSFKHEYHQDGKLKEVKGTFRKNFAGSKSITCTLYDAKLGTPIGTGVTSGLTTTDTDTELTFDFSAQSLDLNHNTEYWLRFHSSAIINPGEVISQLYNTDINSYINGQFDKTGYGSGTNLGDLKFTVIIDNLWGTLIGTIIDGQAITDLKRYWRVKASFTSNTNRDETPTLQSIKADYTTYRRFNKIPDLGYESLVANLSSLTSKVDFFKPASIGQISVGLQMTDAVSNWVYSDTLYNKIVQVKLGYKYDGFVEADYIHYFTGAIDDWSIDSNRVLNLTLKDMSKEWKLPVPSKWESGDPGVTWTNEHHTDVMLDIFQNHINVRDSGLLLDSFATVKAATSGYNVTRTITGKTEDAKKLVEELRVLLMAFFLPRGDGKIGIKQFNSTEAIVATFTDDNTMGIKWKANSKDLINRTSIYFDWKGTGDDEDDFNEYDPGNDTTSQTKFKAIVPYTLKDKWTDVAEATQISGLETKILNQFDDMPARVSITCDAKDIAYESGDMVGVTTVEAPGNSGAGITDEKYLLISKNLDFLGDKIVFEGLKVAI